MPAPVIAAFDPVALDRAPVRLAAALAGFTGAPLLVASVFAGDALVDRLAAGQLADDPLAERSDVLQKAVRMLRGGGVDADALELGATSAARGLSLAAEEVGAGLVVIGSAARGRPGRALAGSTAQRLLDGCPCAVALAPLDWDGGTRWETLGAAFVDSADGRDAVHAAHALARRAGAVLRVVAAVHPRAWMVRDVSYDAVGAELRTAAESAAEAAVAGLVGAPVDVDVTVAEAADVLAGVSADVDLLVCGSRGYGPAPAALLGGVTRRLVEAASCPVLVVAHGAVVRVEALVADDG
jgi:nucleotide-binding universal stress UspA family protein